MRIDRSVNFRRLSGYVLGLIIRDGAVSDLSSGCFRTRKGSQKVAEGRSETEPSDNDPKLSGASWRVTRESCYRCHAIPMLLPSVVRFFIFS
jgi:hypothetical protein